MGNGETLSHCTSRVQGENGADIPSPNTVLSSNVPPVSPGNADVPVL